MPTSKTVYAPNPTAFPRAIPETAEHPALEPPFLTPLIENAIESIEAYGREKPWNLALAAMGVGFLLGWKLKIW